MSERQYKVRAHRRDDGGYDLSFGRQSKALTSTVTRIGKEWILGNGQAFPSKAEALETWGVWVAENYKSGNGGGGTSPETPDTSSEALVDFAPVTAEDEDYGITWAQAFARLANHGKTLTTGQRSDLMLMLNRLIALPIKVKGPPVFMVTTLENANEESEENQVSKADSEVESAGQSASDASADRIISGNV